MGDSFHVFEPAERGPFPRIGDADLALAFALPTSIVGVSASSPPSPMIIGGRSTNCTLRPLALPRPFARELFDWLLDW